MDYVMECGPVFHAGHKSWVMLTLESTTRRVRLRIGPSREAERRGVASELAGLPAECCPSLARFGAKHGWKERPVPNEVHALTAVVLVGLEQEPILGLLAFSPQAEAWLRSCAMFLETKPWLKFSSYAPLMITFGGELTRVLAVGGAGRLPPSLVMLPDHDAFQRAHGRADEALDDAVIISLGDSAGLASERLELAFGQSFHPRMMRLRNGAPSQMTELDLQQFTAALAAVTSLACQGTIGRSVVNGLEAIVVPWSYEMGLRS